jgi:hypothetical protein
MSALACLFVGRNHFLYFFKLFAATVKAFFLVAVPLFPFLQTLSIAGAIGTMISAQKKVNRTGK